MITHADYPAQEHALNKLLDWQKVAWSRQRLERMASAEQVDISSADAFCFGHTPLKQPLTIANLHDINIVAASGNHLTMLPLQ